MKVYYPNTLKISGDFNRTEEALKSRAWTTDPVDSTTYGFTRIPSPSMRKSRKSLDKCSWDYKFSLNPSSSQDEKQCPPVATLSSKSGVKWELHFEDAPEMSLWKQAHFKTELVLPKAQDVI